MQAGYIGNATTGRLLMIKAFYSFTALCVLSFVLHRAGILSEGPIYVFCFSGFLFFCLVELFTDKLEGIQ